jgi:hypothetical protein
MTFPAPSNRLAYGRLVPTEVVSRNENQVDASQNDAEDIDELTADELDDEVFDELCSNAPLCGHRLTYVEGLIGNFKRSIASEANLIRAYSSATVNGWIHAPDPLFTGSGADWKKYVYPDVFVWLPRAFANVKIECPSCGSTNTKANGWPSKPIARRVVNLDKCYFLVGRRQVCNECRKQFNSYDPKVLDRLPARLRHLFPAFLTKRSGVDMQLLTMLREAVSESFGFAGFRRMLYQHHVRRHDQLAVRYYDSVSIIQFVMKTPFPDFGSEDFGGFVPSSRYLADVYLAYMDQYSHVLLAQLAKTSSKVIGIDHSHKIVKRLSTLHGVRVFDALLSVTNEFEEIVSLQFSLGTGKDVQTPFWRGISKNIDSMGGDRPELLYTDQCCQDRRYYESMFPTLAVGDTSTGRRRLEMLQLPRPPVLIDSLASCDLAIECVSTTLNSEGSLCAGFDCEWTFDMATKHCGQVATVQIAVGDSSFVFHLPSCSPRPATPESKGILQDSMMKLLSREDLTLVGRQLGGDLSRLMKDYDVSVKCKTVELGKLARQKRAVEDGRSSLKDLCCKILFRDITKDEEGARLSDWDSPLTPLQIRYAALDAHASLLVYKKLMDPDQFGNPITKHNVRNGLYVAIRVNAITVGFGEIVNYSGKWDKYLCVKIVQVSAPGIQIKAKKHEPASLTKLQEEFPNGAMITHSLLVTAQLIESPAPSVSSCSTMEQLLDDQNKVYTRVKLDPSHWFSRLTSSLDTNHGAFLSFCRVLRDAVFIIDEGDKKLVSEYLEASGEAFETKFDQDSEFILRHVRRTIPQPPILRSRIVQVVDKFRQATDENSKEPLLPPGFDRILRNAMVHVDNGCLSDPPGVKLYYELPSKSTKTLPSYRCIRGTNSNEGTVHQKLIPKFGAQNAGPRLSYTMLLDFSVHNNMKAAIRNKGQRDHGHHDPWLLDELSEAMNNMDNGLENWLGTSEIASPDKYPFLITELPKSVADFEQFDPEFAKSISMQPGLKFLASKMNVKIPVVPVHTKGEMSLFRDLYVYGMGHVIEQWNEKADGKSIFFKIPNLLYRHEETRQKAQNRYETVRIQEVDRDKFDHPHGLVDPLEPPSRGIVAVPVSVEDIVAVDEGETTHMEPSSPVAGPSNKRQRIHSALMNPDPVSESDMVQVANMIAAQASNIDDTYDQALPIDKPLVPVTIDLPDESKIVEQPLHIEDERENTAPENNPKSLKHICAIVVKVKQALAATVSNRKAYKDAAPNMSRTTIQRWELELKALGYKTIAEIGQLGDSTDGMLTLAKFKKQQAKKQ